MIKICRVCGKEYKTSHRDRKTCSRKCAFIRLRKQKIKRICPVCGKEFEFLPSENRKYCSKNCYNKVTGKTLKKDKIKKVCEICGKIFEVSPCRNNQKYCGVECQDIAHSKRMAGKGNSRYGAMISKETRKKIGKANSNPSEETRKRLSEGQIKYSGNPEIIEMRWERKIHTYCDYCGKPIVTFLCLLNNFEKHFCNKECLHNFTRENPRLGKDNPNYFNGKSNEPYPIEFNEILKRKIRKRDNFTCQICGMTQKENIARFKEKLSIHHKDYDKNNLDEDNLIALCKNCHLKTNFKREYWTEYFTEKQEKEVII